MFTICHYLLGRHFVLTMDCAPLQWLSAQKMEGMLCRWALALQEYDFTIKYRRESLNANVDALSCCAVVQSCGALSATSNQLPNLQVDQKADSLTS